MRHGQACRSLVIGYGFGPKRQSKELPGLLLPKVPNINLAEVIDAQSLERGARNREKLKNIR